MAFRDDREQLRQRIRELRQELTTLEAKRDGLADKLTAMEADIALTAKERGGTKVLPALVIGVVAAIAVLGSFCGGGGGARSETLFGRVVASSGDAPAETDARCYVLTEDGGEDWDARFHVLCGGRDVYGNGDSNGYLDCPVIDDADRLVRCRDDDFTDDGGDPRFWFDRTEAKIIIEEHQPAWRMEIALVGLAVSP